MTTMADDGPLLPPLPDVEASVRTSSGDGPLLPPLADDEAPFIDRLKSALLETSKELITPLVFQPLVGGRKPDDVVREYKTYAKMAPDKLPERLAKLDNQQLYDQYFGPEGTVKPDLLKAPFASAAGRGIDQLQDIGYGGLKWVATVLGIPTPDLDEAAKANRKQVTDNPPLISGYQEALESPGKAYTYVAEKIGENLPMAIPSLVSGGGAGIAASAVGAIPKVVAGAQFLGSAAGGIALELGSMFNDAEDAGQRNRMSALVTLAHAVPAGLLEGLSDRLALGRLSKTAIADVMGSPTVSSFFKTGIKKLGAAAVEQAIVEGPVTELPQTILEQMSKATATNVGQDKFWSKWWDAISSPEAKADYVESTVAGALTGGVMGAGFEAPSVLRKGTKKAPSSPATPPESETPPNVPTAAVVPPAAQPEAPVLPPIVSPEPTIVSPEPPIVAPTALVVPSSAPSVPDLSTPEGILASLSVDQAEARLVSPTPGTAMPKPVDQGLYRLADQLRDASVQTPLPVQTGTASVAEQGFRSGSESGVVVGQPAESKLGQELRASPQPVAPPPQNANQVETPVAVSGGEETQAATPVAARAASPVPAVARQEAEAQSPTADVAVAAIPPPAPVQFNQDRSKVATDKASTARAERPKAVPPETVAGLEYLNTNGDHAQAVASFLESPEVTSAVGDDPDGYVRQKLVDQALAYVGKQQAKAFATEGESTTFKAGVQGGFAWSKVVTNAKKDLLKTTKSKVSKKSVSLDEPAEEGGRQLSDTLAAEMKKADLSGDTHGVRAAAMAKYAGDPTAISAGDVILRDIAFGLSGNKGGGVKRSALPKEVNAWVAKNRAGFVDNFRLAIKDLAIKKGITLEEAMVSLVEGYTSVSKFNTGVGTGMTVSDATVAISDMIGRIPDNVVIVDRPGWTTPNGQPVKGVYALDENGNQRIYINSANHSNDLDVRATLVHEAVHRVWSQPRVWQLAQQLMELETGSVVGYDSSIAAEELATRAITGQWMNERSQGVWQKLVNAIWTAIKEVFGFELTNEQMRSVVAAEAIRSLSDSSVTPRGVVRYNTGWRIPKDLAFKNLQQLQAAQANVNAGPNEQRNLATIGNAIGTLVSQKTVQRLEANAAVTINPKAPASVRSGLRARRKAANWVLGQVRGLAEMAMFAPVNIAGIDIDIRDVAANAVLSAVNRFQSFVRGTGRVIKRVQEDLDKAKKNYENVNGLHLKADVAKHVANGIVDSYQEQIDAQSRLGTNLNQQEQAALIAARKALGDIKVKGPAGIVPALMVISDLRPTGVDPLQWVRDQQARGWPSNGGTSPLSAAVYDFMAGPSPALDGMTSEIDRLGRVSNNRQTNQAIVDNVAQLFRSLGATVRNAASPIQFARLYNEWLTKNEEALDRAREYNGDLAKATDDLKAMTLALDELRVIQNSPEFQKQWTDAQEHQDARAKRDQHGRVIVDLHPRGGLVIRNPLNGVDVRLRYSTNPEVVNESLGLAEGLILDIDKWLASNPKNPVLEETYRLQKEQLQSIWLSQVNSLMLTGHVEPVKWSRQYSVQVPRRLFYSPFSTFASGAGLALKTGSAFVGQLSPRSLIYNMVGGTAAHTLFQAMSRTDHASNAVRAAEDSKEFGADSMKRKSYEGAKAHGLDENVSVGQAVEQYESGPINWTMANSQDPATAPTQVGQKTPEGLVITQRDMDVAKQQVSYKQYILDAMSRVVGGVTKYAPYLTNTEAFFRRAVGGPMKMQRRASSWGMEFSRQWEEAQAKDGPTVAGPYYRVNRINLLNDPVTFARIVLDMIATTNSTYTLSDPVQQEAVRNRFATTAGINYHFDNLDRFLDYMGKERERIINTAAGKIVTNEVSERYEAERQLVNDIDREVGLFMDADSNGAEADSRVQSVGTPQSHVISGKSSFSEPRGRQVASNSFYDYTLGSDVNRLMFNASALRYYQKMELDVLGNVITSLTADFQDMQKKFDEFNQANQGPFKAWNKSRFVHMQNQEVKAGKLMTNIRALDNVLGHLRMIQRGMKNAMDRADVEDSTTVRVVSRIEVITSMMKLGVAKVQFTNLLGASFIAPLFSAYAHGAGRFAILNSLAVIAKQSLAIGKNAYRVALAATLGNRPMQRMLKNNKGVFLGLADHFSRQMQQREDDMGYLANQAGAHPPPGFVERFGRWWFQTKRLPSTSGQVTNRPGSTTEAVINTLAIPFSGLAAGSTWMNSGIENFGLRTQVENTKRMLDGIKRPGFQAMKLREARAANMLTPLTPAEIGEQSMSGMKWIRDLFLPAGSLENLLLNYYNRAKGSADPFNEPLMDPGVERDVVQHAMSKGNITNDSDKGEGLKGRGAIGALKSGIFRFMTWPIMFTNFVDQAGRKDIRDNGSSEIRYVASTVALMAALTAVAMFNLGGGQWLREITTGKVPNTPTPSALMAEGPVGWAKGFVQGGANLFSPLFGDYFSGMMTGQKGKDPTDLSSLVPGVGVMAGVGKMVKQIVQSGDAYYPIVGLLKSQVPQFEAVYNQTAEGQSQLAQLNAGRALRSTAGDIETRDSGGGTGGRMTPTTVDARNAMVAAFSGDRAGFDRAVASVVSRARLAGKDPEAVRKSFLRTLASRSPELAVFGKKLTDEERMQVSSRFTPSQRAAVLNANAVGDRIKGWTTTSTAASAGGRRRQARRSYLRPNLGGGSKSKKALAKTRVRRLAKVA